MSIVGPRPERPFFVDQFNAENPYPMVYLRTDGEESILVALNPTAESRKLSLSSEISAFRHETAGMKGNVAPLLSTGKASYRCTSSCDNLTLGPVSGIVIRL